MSTQPIIAERLALIRQSMQEQGISAFIVPHDDQHLGEYTAPRDERLAWATGFTGSAGVAVILADQAALFVDGRYTLQARTQAPETLFVHLHLVKDPYLDWITAQLPSGSQIGVDARLHSLKWFEDSAIKLEKAGFALHAVTTNPIDALWHDRPDAPHDPVILFAEEFAGESSVSKRQRISVKLREQATDAFLLTQNESINWLLNIRGNDIPHLPAADSFAILYSNAAVDLFIEPARLDSQFSSHVGNDVSVYPADHLLDVLKRLGEDKLHVWLDENNCNAAFGTTLATAGATLVRQADPCLLAKACKNEAEVNGTIDAHRKDAVAVCRFLVWLQQTLNAGEAGDESTLADKLESFRAVQDGYLQPSFATISALGPNAALPHYNFRNSTPRPLGLDGIYLVDSGGHYRNGTTDITRTVQVGPVSDDIKRMFTLVMKGHIALSQACFPKGTSGIQLDILARLPLWQAGFDFDHGTGHGVGHVLSVHEGPQRISPKGSLIPLQPGMIVSNEPGYYRESAFGIRCENLVVVEPVSETGEIERYALKNLTLVPFDKRLLQLELLTDTEKNWWNEYHREVFVAIAPFLQGNELLWLEQATAPI
jgi:Xaa-Pro aminopeptidase